MKNEGFAQLLDLFESAERIFRDEAFTVYIVADADHEADLPVKAWAVLNLEYPAFRVLPDIAVGGEAEPLRYVKFRLWGRTLDAVDRFIRLAERAGSHLPNEWRQRLGVSEPGLAASVWVWFLIERLRTEEEGFVSEGPGCLTLRSGFCASVAAIERAGLGEPPRVDKAAQAETPAEREAERWHRLSTAMFLVRDHPEWSNRRIAGEAGVSPSTLSRSKEFQMAARMARGDRRDPPRGYRNNETGELEAWDDEL